MLLYTRGTLEHIVIEENIRKWYYQLHINRKNLPTLRVLGVEDRLDHQEIGAARDQTVNLLLVRLHQLVPGHLFGLFDLLGVFVNVISFVFSYLIDANSSSSIISCVVLI